VRTEDGVLLRGHRLARAPGSAPAPGSAVVFCHGFLGFHQKARLVRFQEELARWFTVYAFDFRGHGASGGRSGLGATEHLDVDAVARLARRDGFGCVATFGGSMGGIAVIRQAAMLGGVDAVVAVSTPARWSGHDTEAVRKMRVLSQTSLGRRVLQAWGVRVPVGWIRTEDPADIVGKVSPTPLVLVHGRDDHFFDEEQAWLLYRRAGEPKRLLLADSFGHAEDGYTPAFAARVAGVLAGFLEGSPPGDVSRRG
jgi:pimeloyl-ACP methyl ester carboxylesterase